MKVCISVFIMAAVTYAIRVLPISLFQKEIKSKYIRSFLAYVPYAVLASLTFPSIFYATNNKQTAILGTVAALLLSYFEQSLVVVAVIAILVVFLSGIFLP